MKIMKTRKKVKSYSLINKNLKFKVKDALRKHQDNYQRKNKIIEEQSTFKMNQYDQQFKQTKN